MPLDDINDFDDENDGFPSVDIKEMETVIPHTKREQAPSLNRSQWPKIARLIALGHFPAQIRRMVGLNYTQWAYLLRNPAFHQLVREVGAEITGKVVEEEVGKEVDDRSLVLLKELEVASLEEMQAFLTSKDAGMRFKVASRMLHFTIGDKLQHDIQGSLKVEMDKETESSLAQAIADIYGPTPTPTAPEEEAKVEEVVKVKGDDDV